jgi:hypothetical protein
MDIETFKKANKLSQYISKYSELSQQLNDKSEEYYSDILQHAGLYIKDNNGNPIEFELPKEIVQTLIDIASSYYEGLLEKFSNDFLSL